MGCCRTPDVMVLCLRSSRRIVAGASVFGLHNPGIHKGGQVVLGLAGSRDTVHVGGIMPSHEYLCGAVVGSEHLAPSALGLATFGLPCAHGLGLQTVAMLGEPLGECRRHRLVEGLFGHRTVVAWMSVQAYLVLHLNHDDGLLLGIHLFQVFHHSSMRREDFPTAVQPPWQRKQRLRQLR